MQGRLLQCLTPLASPGWLPHGALPVGTLTMHHAQHFSSTRKVQMDPALFPTPKPTVKHWEQAEGRGEWGIH